MPLDDVTNYDFDMTVRRAIWIQQVDNTKVSKNTTAAHRQKILLGSTRTSKTINSTIMVERIWGSFDRDGLSSLYPASWIVLSCVLNLCAFVVKMGLPFLCFVFLLIWQRAWRRAQVPEEWCVGQKQDKTIAREKNRAL